MNTVTEEGIRARIADIRYMIIPDSTVTICHITLENGFSMRGESACVDPSNFVKATGEKYAFEDAINKIWQLEGYLLAERLWQERTSHVSSDRYLGTFGWALEKLKRGHKVARSGWNGKGMWLSLSTSNENTIVSARIVPAEFFWSQNNVNYAIENGGAATVLPCITMKTATGEILMGWLASQSDMLANDWNVV